MNALITQVEAAAYYRVSTRTVSQKLKQAKIKHIQKISHTYLYDPQQLHAAMTTPADPIKIPKEIQFNQACLQFITRKPNKC